MAVQEVIVHQRETTGKLEAGRLRKKGLIPGVVYGRKRDPKLISVDPKAIQEIINSEAGRNTLLLLKMAGTDLTGHVMIREVDRHPINEALTHVDFLRVDVDKAVELEVPIHTVGTAAGAKLGGILQFVRRRLPVECLPSNVPGFVEVDVTELGLDESLRVCDIKLPEGVVAKIDPNRVVVVMHSKAVAAVEAEEVAVEEEEAVAETEQQESPAPTDS